MAAVIKGVDDYVDEIVKKKGRHQYKDGLSQDAWEEDIEKVPLFMTKAPEEGAEVSDALAALQALKFDEDDTPEAKALAFKEEGNQYFKLKKYRKALVAYGEGLKQPFEELHLRVVLLTNRSAAHHHLGNNRSALQDATAACKLEPDHLKARIRGAVASVELEHYEEALTWCNDGLDHIDPSNTKLLEMHQTVRKKFRLQQRDQRKAAAVQRQAEAKEKALVEAIKLRGIQLGVEGDEDSDCPIQLSVLESATPAGGCVQLDKDGQLVWPVLFLYPEHGQTDFIQEFHEHSCFSDHLKVMFAKPPPWDIQQKYLHGQLEVYFEDTKTKDFVHVPVKNSLATVLSNSRYVVRAGTPSFLIVPKGSADAVLRQT